MTCHDYPGKMTTASTLMSDFNFSKKLQPRIFPQIAPDRDENFGPHNNRLRNDSVTNSKSEKAFV